MDTEKNKKGAHSGKSVKLPFAMPFCFKRKESVEKAVRRICCERIDAAQKCLQRENHLEGVHDVRREIKKLRAVLRLVRGEIGKKVYGKQTELLRDAANCLTAMRDAHVKLNALKELVKRRKRSHFQQIQNALRQNCRDEEQKFLKSNSVAKVKDILQKLKRQAKDLEIPSDDWPAICSGMKKSYRRGRETFERVRSELLPENFHEWRKRVKDLWLQIRLLCPASPKKLNAMADESESLGNLLGDDHDLFLLLESVIEKNLNRVETTALEKLICHRQKELHAAALKTGTRFYSETPKHFCNRIRNYWNDWRSKK